MRQMSSLTRSPPRRAARLGAPGLVTASALAVAACLAEADDPDAEEDADAGSGGERPPDAAPTPDGEPGVEADAGPDAGPDAEPPCAPPLTIPLDEDMASFFYSHPDCSGEAGFDAGATLIFEDEYDSSQTFSAYAATDEWDLEDQDYEGYACIMDDTILACESNESGELLPIRLTGGEGQLDIEFRFHREAGEVTVESVTYSE